MVISVWECLLPFSTWLVVALVAVAWLALAAADAELLAVVVAVVGAADVVSYLRAGGVI